MNPIDVHEAYRRNQITLHQAASLLRRSRGRLPSLKYPDFFLGWWLRRLLGCPLGFHNWVLDHGLRVPFYNGPNKQCVVCGVIKVKP